MTPERWQQITEVFEAALKREPGEWVAYLAEVCAGDDALRAEVESLLSEDHQVGVSLESRCSMPRSGQ